jgi:hypothetical protein
VRQSFETQGLRLCRNAIQLGNVGFDYETTKPLVARTKLNRLIKVIVHLPFSLSVVVVVVIRTCPCVLTQCLLVVCLRNRVLASCWVWWS